MASYANIDHSNDLGQTPYGSGAPFYNQSQGYITPMQQPTKRGMSPWLKFGVPAALIIAAAVVAGVVATRHHSSASASSSSSSTAPPADPSAAASSAVENKAHIGVFPTSTNSLYMMPVYPSTTDANLFISPTFVATTDAKVAWPADPFAPASPSPTNVRTDRPRLIAPAYKWQALPTLIANDPYMKSWNNTIFGNATDYYNAPPVVYYMDGDSGILDNAREVKQRMKAFGYAYRTSNSTKWVDRAMTELQNAANFGSDPDRWNSNHFLDTAELTAAFGIAYDWMYEAWTDDQKGFIRDTMLKYGINLAIKGLTDSKEVYYTWWSNVGIYGNWNCVCNGGLTLGALAILGDDTTGAAAQILGLTVPNANMNCVYAPSSDGTWAETPNYWYFGTTGHAEMTSALITATGSDYGLLHTNPNYYLTGLYHMYSAGPTSQFNWGDHGPNKYTATANSMLLYGKEYNMPAYTLFQRDQADSADPWSMFWYDPTVAGAFWEGLALDHFFNNDTDTWASMRSSWTDNNALYAGIKAPQLLNHQTHGDLDVGDFVLDALGYRWAGEFGSANYLSTGYFSNETQMSDRWTYYRKRTEGNNCIVVGEQNQNVTATPKLLLYGTTNETQGPTTVYTPPSSSTAFWTADLTSAYDNVTSYLRGIRMLNGRKQVLLQDDINSQDGFIWIMHTNATVTIDSSTGTTATLKINDQTMVVSILNAPSGAKFTSQDAVRFQDDPPVASPQPGEPSNQQQMNNDQPNPGVTQLMISLPAGTYSLQVLFNPQWAGMSQSAFVTPKSVPLTQWSLTSHN